MEEIQDLVEERLRLWLPEAFKGRKQCPYTIQLKDKNASQALRSRSRRSYTMISIVVTWDKTVLPIVEEQTSQVILFYFCFCFFLQTNSSHTRVTSDFF